MSAKNYPWTFSFLILFAVNVGADDSPHHREMVTRFVQPHLDAHTVNAVSVGLVQGDETWTGHFGHLSADSDQAPIDQTVYEIGSISKVFTGLLLADAVVSKQLELDQSIGSIIPELQGDDSVAAGPITLKQLATHSSGLPRLPSNWKPADSTNPYVDFDREKLIEFIQAVRPNGPPGKPSGYSNLAAGLLGTVLADKAGMTYEDLLKERIFGPLGMKDTVITLSGDQRRRLAPPHNADLAADYSWDFDALAGAGAIRSTTADMLRFIKANLDRPAGSIGTTLELAWKQHLDSQSKHFAMGLGWHIARDGSTRWHNGQTGGYHAMLLISRQLNAGVVVLSNTATGQIDAIAESIIQSMAGLKVQPKKFAQAVDVDASVMKRLVGRYELAPTFVLDVRLENDRLMVQATNQQSIRVYPENDTTWNYRVVDAKITFELPEKGPATALTLHQNGLKMPGPRVTSK